MREYYLALCIALAGSVWAVTARSANLWSDTMPDSYNGSDGFTVWPLLVGAIIALVMFMWGNE